MKKSVVARIRPMKLRGQPGIEVRTPFDNAFLDSLKAMVPREDRWWNEAARSWWISHRMADVVTHLVKELFGCVEVTDAEGDKVTEMPGGERLKQESLL